MPEVYNDGFGQWRRYDFALEGGSMEKNNRKSPIFPRLHLFLHCFLGGLGGGSSRVAPPPTYATAPEPPSELVQSILLNVDALAGIAKPARASVSISINTLMNAEARAGFAPKGPTGLLEA